MKIVIFLPNFSNSSAVIYLKNDNWNFGNRKICFHTSACGIWNCAPLLYSSEWRSLLCHFIKMEVAIFDLVSSQFHLNLMHNRMVDNAYFWKDSSNRPIYFSNPLHLLISSHYIAIFQLFYFSLPSSIKMKVRQIPARIFTIEKLVWILIKQSLYFVNVIEINISVLQKQEERII